MAEETMTTERLSRNHSKPIPHHVWAELERELREAEAALNAFPGEEAGDRYDKALTQLLNAPAPDTRALHRKLKILLAVDEGEEFAPAWAAKSSEQTRLDCDRLLAAEPVRNMPDDARVAASSGASIAFDAECAFDDVESELVAISSTVMLLSASTCLTEMAQDAFRSVANSIDSVIARVQKFAVDFNALGTPIDHQQVAAR